MDVVFSNSITCIPAVAASSAAANPAAPPPMTKRPVCTDFMGYLVGHRKPRARQHARAGGAH